MTNGDRIRQMSNEELAKEIQDIILYGDEFDECARYPSIAGIKAYLESEAKE